MTNEHEIDLDALFLDGMEEGASLDHELQSMPLECDPEFLAEYTKARFLEDLLYEMELQGISASELSRRLGKSRQYVSRILQDVDNQENFTVETLAKLSTALGRTFTLSLHDPREQVLVLPQSRVGSAYRFKPQEPVRITVDDFSNCISLDELGHEYAGTEISAA